MKRRGLIGSAGLGWMAALQTDTAGSPVSGDVGAAEPSGFAGLQLPAGVVADDVSHPLSWRYAQGLSPCDYPTRRDRLVRAPGRGSVTAPFLLYTGSGRRRRAGPSGGTERIARGRPPPRLVPPCPPPATARWRLPSSAGSSRDAFEPCRWRPWEGHGPLTGDHSPAARCDRNDRPPQVGNTPKS
jgi:hypothetical protein